MIPYLLGLDFLYFLFIFCQVHFVPVGLHMCDPLRECHTHVIDDVLLCVLS